MTLWLNVDPCIASESDRRRPTSQQIIRMSSGPAARRIKEASVECESGWTCGMLSKAPGREMSSRRNVARPDYL